MKKSEVEMLLAMIKRDCEHEWGKPSIWSKGPNGESSSAIHGMGENRDNPQTIVTFGKETTFTATYTCQICKAWKEEPYHPTDEYPSIDGTKLYKTI